MNITIGGSDLEILPLDDYSGEPEVFIYSYEDRGQYDIPENCSIDSFFFSIDGGNVYGEHGEIVGKGAGGKSIRERYPLSKSGVFIFDINEPDNEGGRMRKEFLLDQTRRFQFNVRFRPFAEYETVYYEYHEDMGCLSSVFPEEFNLSLNDLRENIVVRDSEQVICVKSTEKSNRNIEGCSFFEVSSKVSINVDVLEKLASEGKHCSPLP
mgnify:CR=1 FL=1